jgi:hypothetical protein
MACYRDSFTFYWNLMDSCNTCIEWVQLTADTTSNRTGYPSEDFLVFITLLYEFQNVIVLTAFSHISSDSPHGMECFTAFVVYIGLKQYTNEVV